MASLRMPNVLNHSPSSEQYSNAQEYFEATYEQDLRRINRLMIALMVLQWLAAMAAALFFTPHTYLGQQSAVHAHVWATALIGFAISGSAILAMRYRPYSPNTRHIVAAMQMLWGALIIHVSGGRIEAHFHIFVSIAILSIYRDWRILVTATVVIALDHYIRGIYYPLSVFGVSTASEYRWLEHSVWVCFEVAFLGPSCARNYREIRELCNRQFELTEAKQTLDHQVAIRTHALEITNQQLSKKTIESEMLAVVARYTDNAVAITDCQLNIQWINESFTRITGRSEENAMGKCLVDLLLCSGTDRFAAKRLMLAGELQQGFTGDLLSADVHGRGYWVSAEIRPIPDEKGNINRFIAIQRDITKLKTAETSLRSAEQRMRSLMNNVPGAYVRRQGTGEQRISYASDTLGDLMRVDPAVRKLGTTSSYLELIAAEDRERVTEQLREITSEGQVFELEYRIGCHGATPDQCKPLWIWERGQCIRSQTSNHCALLDSVLLDITDRVAVQSQNAALQEEMVSLSRNAGMAEVATGVLHNVGNVLNSVNTSVALLTRQTRNSALNSLQRVCDLVSQHEQSFDQFVSQDPRGKRLPEFLSAVTNAMQDEQGVVQTELESLVSNVEHIIAIVKFQQSLAGDTCVVQKLEAKDIIQQAINGCGLRRHDDGVHVLIEVDSLQIEFESDRHRILQILINLLRNARDAISDREAGTGKITIRCWRQPHAICFSVSDNGVGIAPDALTKVFRSGYTSKSHGHGFGLHSSANAAEELGGRLTAASDGPEKGAEFTLTIPV